mgnify:FL=1|jgi:electron transfer flavoprotein alpha subunit
MGMDLSDLQALMGGSFDEVTSESGGVWVVSPDGRVDDGLLRLVGKARVVADALGGYVTLLVAGEGAHGDAGGAIPAGADKIVTASGVPAAADLADFFRERSPQAVLLPRTPLGRAIAPALAQLLDGSLCDRAADLAVDPIYQRLIAHQPILDDAARMTLSLLNSPAIVAVDTDLLPSAFQEPWRQGETTSAEVAWGQPPAYEPVKLAQPGLTLHSAPVVVVAGWGLADEVGVAAARELAHALGGFLAGDESALDAGWVTEDEVVGLTGATIAPSLCIALGVDGDTNFMMGTVDALCVVSAQADAQAPIVPFADYNIIADPAQFARELVAALR